MEGILLLDDDDIDDVMLLDIINENIEENLGDRGVLYGRFNLDLLLNVECEKLFRFKKHDIARLATALDIPERIITNVRVCVSGIEGLCILLRRLSYPNRLVDLEPLFGLSSSAISSIFNFMVNFLAETKGHLFANLRNNAFFTNERLIYYADAIVRKGSPVPNCWGFIDGTVRPICRPTVNQEQYYSGHKRTHCVKFQSVICPDGIVISLKGAYEGRRHDAGIFRDSMLYDELLENTVFPARNQHFVLYGDQAYGLRELLLRPYSQNEINDDPNRQNFNNSMSILRIAVEWGFSKIIQLFAFLDFKKNYKLLLQDVGNMYNVGMILTNCHTCLYGSETAAYFDVNPPTLEEYLGD